RRSKPKSHGSSKRKVTSRIIRSTRAARIRELRSSINLWTDRARLRDGSGSVAPGCAVTLARMKSRGSLVEWVWRSFQLHAAFYRDAKQESKRAAANCCPTSGDDLRCNDLPNHSSCHESEIKRSRFPTRLR